MPRENTHVCVITTKSYDEYRVSKCARKVGPKKRCVDHFYGIFEKDGKRTSEIHELWFPVEAGWTVSAAKNYCEGQGGVKFYEALPEEKKTMGIDVGEGLTENDLFEFLTVRAPVTPMPQGVPAQVLAVFEERVGVPLERAYLFPVRPSTQAIDAYGTRMSEQALGQYARDADGGVPLLNSHRTGGGFFVPRPMELPLGYSFYGELVGIGIDETPLLERDEEELRDQDVFDQGMALRAYDYVLRDHHPNGPANVGTNDVITGIEGRTLRDLSIGFGSARPERLRYICGLCGYPIGAEECEHIPMVRDKESGLLAFAWVYDAKMYEHSLVWAGATPGAYIEKARAEARAGRLDGVEVDLLESVWQVRIRPRVTAVSVASVEGASTTSSLLEEKEEVRDMGVEERDEELGEAQDVVSVVAEGDGEPEPVTATPLPSLRAVERVEVSSAEPVEGDVPEMEGELSVETSSTETVEEVERGAGPGPGVMASDLNALREMVDQLTEAPQFDGIPILEKLDELNARLVGLEVQAGRKQELGEQYFQGLVDEAVRAKVRAGFVFNEGQYRERLEGMEPEEIEDEVALLDALVARQFRAGRVVERPDLQIRGDVVPGRALERDDDVALYKV